MPKPDSPFRDLVEAAAATLAADPLLRRPQGDAIDLLHTLGYGDGDISAAPGRVRLLRAAAWLSRLFLIPVPDAPGLVFFGAEADPAAIDAKFAGMPQGSMAGSGLAAQRAFQACVGEAVEYLSQFVRPADRMQRGPASGYLPDDPPARRFILDVLAACEIDAQQPISWAAVRSVGSESGAWFPAELCLRRPPAQRDFIPPLKLSTGCAAGATHDDAALRGMLELIERDAAALWWRGGRRGRSIPFDSALGKPAAALLNRLRQGQSVRRTWLLDITTDLGVPVVVALSSDPDGYGFAFGFGARLTLADAACAALYEMCQVELGAHVVAAKQRESGDTALREDDLRQLRRVTLLNTSRCALLHPAGVTGTEGTGFSQDPAEALRELSDLLAGHDIAVFTLDLTRPEFDIPVVRVLAPGLQREPCAIIGSRLAEMMRATGGALRHTGGLPLL